MGWSGGTYTKGNAGTGGWAGDQSLGIGIEASRHDTQDNDFATGINQCLNKDGSNAATGNLNLGGFKLTNAAVGTVSSDVTTLGQAQAGIDQNRTATEVNWNINKFSADNSGTNVFFNKSRGATVGTNTIAQNGDVVGALIFRGANGTGYDQAALIVGSIDGVPGASADMPGRLTFHTTPDGTSTAVERMRIDNSGKVGIGGTPTWNLDIIGNLNGDYASRLYNSNSGITANAQFLFGNDTNSAAVGLRLNSSTNTGLGGVNAFNIYQGLAAPICLFTSGTVRQTIASNGIHTMHAYGAGTATFSAAGVISSVSDERLKVKDGSITDPLTKIEALQPGYWRWKDEMQDELGSQRELGFFAQNVNAAIGEEAAPVPEEGKRWGYYDRSVLAVAVEAIKELHAKVKTLEAKVAALES